MALQRNTGRLPPECEIRDDAGNVTGYRAVHVKFFNGWSSREAGHQPWPSAGSRPPTDWTISRKSHPFQIEEYEVL